MSILNPLIIETRDGAVQAEHPEPEATRAAAAKNKKRFQLSKFQDGGS
jgi:hypothetical protein